MRAKRKSLPVCLVLFWIISAPVSSITVSGSFPAEDRREYKIKAGFLYKFLFFAHWSGQNYTNGTNGGNGNVIIGIIGKDKFGDVFKLVEGELVEGRRLVIQRFDNRAPPELLSQCRVLYICPHLEQEASQILASIKGQPVLTVSEFEGFGERGGMINFVKNEDKVAFEINVEAAEQAGITFSSKLLRVAVRIIGDKYERRFD